MAFIAWPTREVYLPETNYQTTGSGPMDIQSATIQLMYPGRDTVKAEFSNRELVVDKSSGEWAGSVTLAGWERNSPEHRAIQIFLAEMNDDPGENWTLIPWEEPSIFTLQSVVGASHAVAAQDNDKIAEFSTIANGIGQLTALPAIASNESLAITPGEHFGYRNKTYKIKTASFSSQTQRWNIQSVPALPDTMSGGDIYKRFALPARIVGGQNLADSKNANSAGPFSFSVVEYPTA